MASPKLITDASSAFEESVVNRALMSDGTKVEVKVWHARIRYNGSDTVVESSVDSAGFTSAAVVFNSGDTTFDITISGFTNIPVASLTRVGISSYEPVLTSATNVLLKAAFTDTSDGSQIVTGTEDTDMHFDIILIGF